MMTMLHTENLPADGASYKCAVETLIGEAWRCPKVATLAVSEADYERLVAAMPKTIVLHGRAMCPTHLNMMDRDY